MVLPEFCMFLTNNAKVFVSASFAKRSYLEKIQELHKFGSSTKKLV